MNDMQFVAFNPADGTTKVYDGQSQHVLASDFAPGTPVKLGAIDPLSIKTHTIRSVLFSTLPILAGTPASGNTLTGTLGAISGTYVAVEWRIRRITDTSPANIDDLTINPIIPGATDTQSDLAAISYAIPALGQEGWNLLLEARAQTAKGAWIDWVKAPLVSVQEVAAATLVSGDWTFTERQGADVRKAHVTVANINLTPGRTTRRVYWGDSPTGSTAFLTQSSSVMTRQGDGTWLWDSTSQAPLGSASARTVRYATIYDCDDAGGNPVLITPEAKSITISSVPAKMDLTTNFTAAASTTVSGRVNATVGTLPSDSGNALDNLAFSVNGGAITDIAGAATTGVKALDLSAYAGTSISLRMFAKNDNGYSSVGAAATVTPPVIVGSVNEVAPTIDSTFYGQSWYQIDTGIWTNDPTLTVDFEYSNDGATLIGSITAAWVTGTAYTVGMRVTNGGTTYRCLADHTAAASFSTDLTATRWEIAPDSMPLTGSLPKTQLDSKYVRAKVTPAVGSPAYSSWYLVRPSYSHVLSWGSDAIDRTITSPFLGYELTTGGIWMQCLVYFAAGVDFSGYIMSLGQVSSNSNYIAMSANGALSNLNGTSLGGTSGIGGTPSTTEGRWYVVTARWYKAGGTVYCRAWRNEVAGSLASASASFTLASSSFNRLRLGNRATTSLGTTDANYRACCFAIGTGDPSLVHDWVYNEGKLRNVIDYNFAGDANGCSIGFFEKGYRVGSATWATTDMVDDIGTLDTVTATTGAPTWSASSSVLPGFIKRLGPAPTIPAANIMPQYAPAGTQMSFQWGAWKPIEASLSASPWATATAYAVGARVTQGGLTYICAIAHTSGTFATDLSGAKWVVYTINTVTHVGFSAGDMRCPAGSASLGDIKASVVNGIFTCTTPGTITANVTVGVAAAFDIVAYVYPACPMPATPRKAAQYRMNGLIAALEQYPTPAAAPTSFANAAALAAAAGSLSAGGYLCVDNISDAASNLTLPNRDYGGAVIECKNLDGVEVNHLYLYGVRNLTLRGVKANGNIYGGGSTNPGVHNLWLDHCSGIGFRIYAYTQGASSVRVTNFSTPETGLSMASTFFDFKEAILLRAAFGDAALGNDSDSLRWYQCERIIADRVYVGDNKVSAAGAHADLWQIV